MHIFWNVQLHVSGGGFEYKRRKLCLYPALLPVQMLSFHRCQDTQRTSQGIKTKLAPVHECGFTTAVSMLSRCCVGGGRSLASLKTSFI